jgi:hypothetical protein
MPPIRPKNNIAEINSIRLSRLISLFGFNALDFLHLRTWSRNSSEDQLCNDNFRPTYLPYFPRLFSDPFPSPNCCYGPRA